MNRHLKIKRLFLAGIIALALFLGALGMANRIQTASSVQLADGGAGGVTVYSICWKCTG
jgi:hypothetical protein